MNGDESVAAGTGNAVRSRERSSAGNASTSPRSSKKRRAKLPGFQIDDNGSVTVGNRSSRYPEKVLRQRLDTWLKTHDLEFDPFRHLDAGRDPWLGGYLVDLGAYTSLWGDWPSFLYARRGAGKSAFRVRLGYDCRSGWDSQRITAWDGRRVFPIFYPLPHGSHPLESHLAEICKKAAHELLLEFSWRPDWFMKLEPWRKEIRRVFDWNAPDLLKQLLPQLRDAGSPKPIYRNYDPSAVPLDNPPTEADVRELCDMLESVPKTKDVAPPPGERFEHLLVTLLSGLEREAVYLLVDDVDAHAETAQNPATAFEWMRPLLGNLSRWEAQRAFPKFFLPLKLRDYIGGATGLLTPQTKSANIEWTRARLADLLQKRVWQASGGPEESLNAISSQALHPVEETLTALVQPNPRAVLNLVEQALLEHVRHDEPSEKLQPDDLKRAIALIPKSDRFP